MNQLRRNIVERLAAMLPPDANRALDRKLKIDYGVINRTMRYFIPEQQRKVIVENTGGEEGDFFRDKMRELTRTVLTMPKVYQTDGQGNDAIVHLHYFIGNSDWYITERDTSDAQIQAFGYAVLNGDTEYGELGYISIEEILKINIRGIGAELDLYWTPKTLGEVKKEIRGLSDNVRPSLFDFDTEDALLSDAPASSVRMDILRALAAMLPKKPAAGTPSHEHTPPRSYAPESAFAGKSEREIFEEITEYENRQALFEELQEKSNEYRQKIYELDEVPDDWTETKAKWYEQNEKKRKELAKLRDEYSSAAYAVRDNDDDDKANTLYEEYVDEQFAKQGGKPTDEQKQAYIDKLSEQSFTVVTGLDYFPTPPDIARQAVEKAGIECGQTVLEPSAGKGNIADIIRQEYGDCVAIDVVEYSSHNRKILELKGYNIVGSDFQHYAVAGRNERNVPQLDPNIRYDRIVMNPPYMKGIDWIHVRRAYELLKPDGQLTAIVPAQSYVSLSREAKERQLFIESNDGSITIIPAAVYNRNMEHGKQILVDIAIITMRRLVKEEYESDLETTDFARDGEFQRLPKTGKLTPPDRSATPPDTTFVQPEILTAQAEFVPREADIPDYVATIKAGRDIVVYDPTDEAGQRDALRLFEHQYFGINLAIHALTVKGGFLLADGTGAGKTIQMLMNGAYWYQKTGKPVVIFTVDKRVIVTSFMADAKKLGFPVPQYAEQTEVAPVFRSESYRGLYDGADERMETEELTYAQRVLGGKLTAMNAQKNNLPALYYGNAETFELKNGINLFTYDALSAIYSGAMVKRLYSIMQEAQEAQKINQRWWLNTVLNLGKERIKDGTFDEVLRAEHTGGQLTTKEEKKDAWREIVEAAELEDTRELHERFAGYFGGIARPKMAEAGLKAAKAAAAYEKSIEDLLSNLNQNASLVIFDEAHKVKNVLQDDDIMSGRAYYAKFIHDACARVLFATATPCDRPFDILYLKRAGLFTDDEDFKRRMKLINIEYKPPKKNADGVVVRPGRWHNKMERSDDAFANYQLATLFDFATRQGCMVRREIQYTNLESVLLDVIVPHGVKKDLADITRSLERVDSEGRTRANRVVELKRHLEAMEEYKIAEVERIVEREVLEGRNVIIFAENVDTGTTERTDLSKKLGTVRILKNRLSKTFGEDNVGVLVSAAKGYEEYKRLLNVSEFQSGEKRVLISTITSGGTGINLDDQKGNAPRTIIIMTAPLSFINIMQGLGRVVRANTKSRSRVYFLFAKTDHPDAKERHIAVESWLKNLIGYKFRTLRAAVKGEIDAINPTAIHRIENGGEGAAASEFEQTAEQEIPPQQHSLYKKAADKLDGRDMPTSQPLIIERFGDRYGHYCMIKADSKEQLETWARANQTFIQKHELQLNIHENWQKWNGSHYGRRFYHNDTKNWKESYEVWNALLNIIKPEEAKVMDSETASFASGDAVVSTTDILAANARKGTEGKITAVVPVTIGRNANGDIIRYEYDVEWKTGGRSMNTPAWQLSLPEAQIVFKYRKGDMYTGRKNDGGNPWAYVIIDDVALDAQDQPRYSYSFDFSLNEDRFKRQTAEGNTYHHETATNKPEKFVDDVIERHLIHDRKLMKQGVELPPDFAPQKPEYAVGTIFYRVYNSGESYAYKIITDIERRSDGVFYTVGYDYSLDAKTFKRRIKGDWPYTKRNQTAEQIRATDQSSGDEITDGNLFEIYTG